MKMSKMKMPEMSVVRFNESDVIVASAPAGTWIRLVKFGDGEQNTATITRGGNVIFSNIHSQGFDPADYQLDDFTRYGGGYTFQTNGAGPVSLNGLIEMDNTGSTNPGVDGYYEWDGNGTFSYKCQ